MALASTKKCITLFLNTKDSEHHSITYMKKLRDSTKLIKDLDNMHPSFLRPQINFILFQGHVKPVTSPEDGYSWELRIIDAKALLRTLLRAEDILYDSVNHDMIETLTRALKK